MLLGFIEHLIVYLIFYVLMFRLAGRKPWGLSFLIALALAFSLTVRPFAFGCHPELDRGWLGDAVVAGTAVIICIPFSLLLAMILKRRPKHDHHA